MAETKKDNLYKIARPGKRFLAMLADLFILFIICSGLYSVAVYPLLKNVPYYKSALNEQEAYVEKCRQMYIDGKIMENGITPEEYIEKAVKNKINDSNNDIFVYYYATYLPTIHNDGVAITNYDINYVNNNVYNYENQGDVVLYELDGDISNPLKLTDNAKNMLNNYYSVEVTKENEAYHSKIVNQYKNALIEGEKILKSSDEFKDNYAVVNKDNTKLYLCVSISCMITYTVFFILFYIVGPLLLKNGQTFGKRILKIGLYHDTNTPIRKNILILRAILQYLIYYFIVILIPLWQIGVAVINLPALVFPTFTINLFLLSFASLLLAIVSFIIMLATQNKQALHDKAVGVYAYRMDVELDEENDIKNEEFNKSEESEE